MKRLLVLSVLTLGLVLAGATVAQAQCYPAPVVRVYAAPYYGYVHPRHHVVRQAYFRPTYYGRYSYRPYIPPPCGAYRTGY